jgi:hypothetical protein
MLNEGKIILRTNLRNLFSVFSTFGPGLILQDTVSYSISRYILQVKDLNNDTFLNKTWSFDQQERKNKIFEQLMRWYVWQNFLIHSKISQNIVSPVREDPHPNVMFTYDFESVTRCCVQ